jgi:hypothetical protein
MKLDESIELINKKKNINEMNNLTNLPVSEMRNCMHEMMADENMSGCLYEVLTQEGFLPETLAEGEDYGTHCESMMEDDMIAEEMFKSCRSNMSECGNSMQNYLSEKLTGDQYKLDKNHNGKIDGGDFKLMQQKNEGIEEGEEGGSRYMFFSNLELIKHHVEEMMAMDPTKIESILENGHDWAADHIATAKESIDQVFDFLTGEAAEGQGEIEMPSNMGQPTIAIMGNQEEPMMEADEDDEDDEESPTYLLNKKRVLDQEIAKYSKYVDKFIPMVDKLDPATMNQYYNTELREVGEYSTEAFKNFLTKKEDESSVDYYDRLTRLGTGYPDVFSGLVEPRKRGYFAKFGDKIGFDTLDMMEDVLSDIFDKKNEIYTKKADIEKIEGGLEDRNAEKEFDNDFEGGSEMGGSAPRAEKNIDAIVAADELGLYDDDDETLEEGNLPDFKPVIGKNVQSINKSDSEDSEKEELKDVEDSQETTEEKVDNLKNQKFAGNTNMESEFEQEVREKKQLGAFNALNLDFQNEVPQSYKDRVELEVTTGHSRKRDEAKFGKEANVDHEATKRTGEKMIAASKANQGEKDSFYKPNPILAVDSLYEPTSVTGKEKGGKKNPGGGDLNENALADIERMKKMFGYEEKLVVENKTPKELNENEILFKSVSTKKFI